ncbi:hypothetical protein [Paludisphaera sp.]|uniref:hypothetical protein n=1 Tax=Paludisphaera sp. TaxID=2017432 RepID=UPI00301C2EC2
MTTATISPLRAINAETDREAFIAAAVAAAREMTRATRTIYRPDIAHRYRVVADVLVEYTGVEDGEEYEDTKHVPASRLEPTDKAIAVRFRDTDGGESDDLWDLEEVEEHKADCLAWVARLAG